MKVELDRLESGEGLNDDREPVDGTKFSDYVKQVEAELSPEQLEKLEMFREHYSIIDGEDFVRSLGCDDIADEIAEIKRSARRVSLSREQASASAPRPPEAHPKEWDKTRDSS